ncbi:MAG: alpha/beta fold hydrolase [Solirubrobacterales bacterium]
MHVFGEEALAPANGIELDYQEMGDPAGEPLLLVMGLSLQMIAWDEEFCSLLADRGFRVIRFDNRDVGRSTRFDAAGVPTRFEMLSGRRAPAAYLLPDLAHDSFGLLDHLGIESAHLVGASMGGMVVQQMAIERPGRVRSLVSVMSTTGSRRVPPPRPRVMRALLGPPPSGREAMIERAVQTFRVIGSPGFPFEEARLRELAGESFDRGFNPAGVARQLHAILASGNRTRGLGRLALPATVIHGASDPLVRPAGGRATARAIPGARLRMVEGMGHDLPRQLWESFAEDIAANAARAASGPVGQPA